VEIRKEEGDRSGVKLSPGKVEESCFPSAFPCFSIPE